MKIARPSACGRYLVNPKGEPFILLADTAWELIHRTNREDVRRYVQTRRCQGFTGFLTVILAELDGLAIPSAIGDLPLLHHDPTQLNESYLRHVDDVIEQAERNGMWVGLLPTWGDKWNQKWGVGPEIFTPENARKFGELLGRRYRNRSVLWVLGGDRPLESKEHWKVIRGMAIGILDGTDGQATLTFHPSRDAACVSALAQEDWIDFVGIQSGHTIKGALNHLPIRERRQKCGTVPFLDLEPCYEDHPVMKESGEPFDPTLRWTDYHARRAIYWSLLSGACGVVYGSHAVWQFWDSEQVPVHAPREDWRSALASSGAEQMCVVRSLLEEPGFLATVPLGTDSMGVNSETYLALRGCRETGTYYLYVPNAQRISLGAIIPSGIYQGEWISPVNGSKSQLGPLHITQETRLTLPTSWTDGLLRLVRSE